MDANMEREKAIFKETFVTPPCPFQSDLDIDSDLDNDLASEVIQTHFILGFLLNNSKLGVNT